MNKKNKLAAAYNKIINNINAQLNALKAIQQMEREKNLKLLPITDTNKLGVLYTCTDTEGEIQISFFDRTKTTSTFDVVNKGLSKKYDIVGEDCLFYPAKIVGAAIVPNWEITSMFNSRIIGSMNFSDFVKRMAKCECN